MWETELVGDAEEVDHAVLDRAVELLDELAERWHALQVGGSVTLTWPWPEGRRHPASHRTRKSQRRVVRKRAQS